MKEEWQRDFIVMANLDWLLLAAWKIWAETMEVAARFSAKRQL